MLTFRQLAVLAPLLLLAAGCYSRLTGNEGNFTFAYPASADVLNFNKPIAPGARMDLFARSLGADEELTIVAAESTEPDVLKVIEVHSTHVVVQGGTVGTTRLVLTTAGGTRDSVDLHVAAPLAAHLAHTCTDDAFAVYPANSEVVIPFGLQRGGGQPVIGYGFWPIKVRPSQALKLDRSSRDQGALHFRTGSARHRASIRSTIDDTVLGLAIVENSAVNGIATDAFGIPSLIENQETGISFMPMVEGVPFCQSSMLTRGRSLTPQICTVSANVDEDSENDENRVSILRVKARAYGVCEFELTYPEAAGGAGVSRRYKLAVGKFPSLEEAHDAALPTWLAPLLALLVPLSFLPFVRRRA